MMDYWLPKTRWWTWILALSLLTMHPFRLLLPSKPGTFSLYSIACIWCFLYVSNNHSFSESDAIDSTFGPLALAKPLNDTSFQSSGSDDHRTNGGFDEFDFLPFLDEGNLIPQDTLEGFLAQFAGQTWFSSRLISISPSFTPSAAKFTQEPCTISLTIHMSINYSDYVATALIVRWTSLCLTSRWQCPCNSPKIQRIFECTWGFIT